MHEQLHAAIRQTFDFTEYDEDDIPKLNDLCMADQNKLVAVAIKEQGDSIVSDFIEQLGDLTSAEEILSAYNSPLEINDDMVELITSIRVAGKAAVEDIIDDEVMRLFESYLADAAATYEAQSVR